MEKDKETPMGREMNEIMIEKEYHKASRTKREIDLSTPADFTPPGKTTMP